MSRKINPNLKHLYQAENNGFRGAVLKGSSRSGKTFSSIHYIIRLCATHKTPITINIVKETYNSFKTTLYDDFNRILPEFGLYSPFLDKKEVDSFKILGHKINLLGADKPSKFHGASCDYLYFNEMLDVSNDVFDQSEMRCRKFWWGDFNPKLTQHWVFDKIVNRPDVSMLTTTWEDNPYISIAEKSKILSYEPTQKNIEAGTADDYKWKVYGLGIGTPPEGLIFKHINYIKEWPVDIAPVLGMDFGFTCFDGETLIDTIEGKKYIKDITTKDYVLTKEGYKKVLKLHNNGLNSVTKKHIELDFGYKEIISTFNHKFKTINGWKQFKDLQDWDILCINANLTGEITQDIQTGNTQTTSFQRVEKKQDFIEIFGNTIMVKYQKASKYIISIITRLITLLLTSCLLVIQNMLKYIAISMELSQKKAIQKKIGAKEELRLKINLKKNQENVSGAWIHILQQIPIKDFAVRNAIIYGSIKALKITKLIFANLAVALLKGINILNKRHVQSSVPISYQLIKDVKNIKTYNTHVYDIHVSEEHNYFANGVLVHNCDPTALLKVGENKTDIYLELLLYQPTETSSEIDDYARQRGINKHTPCTADSSDKHTGENKGTVEMVKELKKKGWNIKKVRKTKSIMFWLGKMKEKRLNVIINDLSHHMKTEQQNYRLKEVNGIKINQPIDGFNHGFDGGRYGFMSLNENKSGMW